MQIKNRLVCIKSNVLEGNHKSPTTDGGLSNHHIGVSGFRRAMTM